MKINLSLPFRNINKKHVLTTVIGLLLFSGAIYFTYQYMSTRSHADIAEVTYFLSAGSCQTKAASNTCKISKGENQNFTVDIDLSSGAFMSGTDLIFSYNRGTPGQLEFVSYTDALDAFGTEVIKEIHSHPQGYNLLHLTLVNERDDSKLKKRAVIRLTFKGVREGVTRVNLISSSSTVVGPGASGAYSISPQSTLGPAGDTTPEGIMKNIPNIHVTTSENVTNPTGTNPTGNPPVTGTTGIPQTTPSTSQNITFDIRTQGLTKPAKNVNEIPVKVTFLQDERVIDTRSVSMSKNDDGSWTGNSEYDNLTIGVDYTLLVKGPKHLQKKVCTNNPTESIGGQYSCLGGEIRIQASDNRINLKGIVMLAGDIPLQNGIVDAVDITYIRSNLGKTDAEVVARGDLNYDGIVDTQDYGIIINALSFKYDEKE